MVAKTSLWVSLGGVMSALPDWLIARLARAPDKPGCYLMVGKNDEIVYIGKAKNLRARLNQYFAPGSSDNRFFVGLLDKILHAIEFIVAASDKEALILENSLIKEHRPRFNVRLKDDSNFLHILLDRKHSWPRLEVVRSRENEETVFGPYESATSIRRTLQVVNRHFQLRTCSDSEFKQRKRPCLEYQIGRCLAPCVQKVDTETYRSRVDEVRLFLAGRNDSLIRRLENKMKAASEAMHFELAAQVRDQLNAIKRSLVPQSVAVSEKLNADVLGIARQGGATIIELMKVRLGSVISARAFPLKNNALPTHELVEDFLAAYYDGTTDFPREILLPIALEDRTAWESILGEAANAKLDIKQPKRGTKFRLVTMAVQNATEAIRHREAPETEHVLLSLQRILGLSRLPLRIECFDISNIQGKEAVGSMVVAEEGRIESNAYRSYRIRGQDSPDDYAMMYEVLTRRLTRGLEEGDLPDLIMVDGGKGQLNVAVRVLKELDIDHIDLIGIAKSRPEDGLGNVRRGPLNSPSGEGDSERPDRIFRPGRTNPVRINLHSDEMHLLQHLRDEAHRFAITYHKALRRKRTLASELDAIEGVGPARKRLILRHFGSVQRLRAASKQEVYACPGLPTAVADRLYTALQRG
jgi:excinuclease ABC subunit C